MLPRDDYGALLNARKDPQDNRLSSTKNFLPLFNFPDLAT